ncbi:MAG: hypothetical protein R3E66_14745 [bacterium]
MALRHILLNEALKKSESAVRTAKDMSTIQTVKAASSGGVIKELATMCGRAGVSGAIVEGSMGAFNAAKALKDGRIDKQGAAKHVASEASCGFITSSAGLAGALAVIMVTGSNGPLTLAAGMGASMGSRWMYKKVVGETLPDDKNKPDAKDEQNPTEWEEIGPND